MMDITARLRRHPYSWTSVHHEAAQEIERLRKELKLARWRFIQIAEGRFDAKTYADEIAQEMEEWKC